MENHYIKRVTIEGESGYVLVSEAYHETLEITPRKIIYEYEPYVNIKGNTYAKWLFETKDPAFDRVFNKIHHIAI